MFSGYLDLDDKCIIVLGQDQIDKLKELGQFGETLNEAQRKDISRRSGTDKHISYSHANILEKPALILFLEEAYYLAYTLGCLSIFLDEANKQKATLNECWLQMITMDPFFIYKFAAYYFFRSHEWVVKKGSNFGTHFVLYKKGPSLDHSPYAILVVPEEQTFSWQPLRTIHRVVHSVNKDLILVKISQMKSTQTVECIKNAKISYKILYHQNI